MKSVGVISWLSIGEVKSTKMFCFVHLLENPSPKSNLSKFDIVKMAKMGSLTIHQLG